MHLLMRAGLWAFALLAVMMLGGFRPAGVGMPVSGDPAEPVFYEWMDRYRPVFRQHVSDLFPAVDTNVRPRVLMLNYSAYDSAYANKVLRIIHQQIPGALCTNFWDGKEAALQAVLQEQDVVVVVYPSGGEEERIAEYGRVLTQFVEKGGVVVFTGTHIYKVLQYFGLLKLNKGYFCKEPLIESEEIGHPLQEGIPSAFRLTNYAYPLELTDPGFRILAGVQGFPVWGVKDIGDGQVVYIGLEYYYDEPVSSRIMVNAILSAWHPAEVDAPPMESVKESQLQRLNQTTELLYAGTGRNKNTTPFDLKIYPNPYLYKATLEVDLPAMATVSIEMTDENGRLVSTLLPRMSINQGFYRFELPDVAAGIYFVRYSQNDQHTVRKIVKAEAP